MAARRAVRRRPRARAASCSGGGGYEFCQGPHFCCSTQSRVSETSTAHIHAPLRRERGVPATRSQRTPLFTYSSPCTLVTSIPELFFHTHQTETMENACVCLCRDYEIFLKKKKKKAGSALNLDKKQQQQHIVNFFF